MRTCSGRQSTVGWGRTRHATGPHRALWSRGALRWIVTTADGGGVMDKDLAQQVVDVAARVVASGAISANGHGNVSLRQPGSDEMYFTAGTSLRDHPLDAVVRVGLDGSL